MHVQRLSRQTVRNDGGLRKACAVPRPPALTLLCRRRAPTRTFSGRPRHATAKNTARRAKFLGQSGQGDDDANENLQAAHRFAFAGGNERGVTIPLKRWLDVECRFEQLAERRRFVGDGWDYYNPLQTPA